MQPKMQIYQDAKISSYVPLKNYGKVFKITVLQNGHHRHLEKTPLNSLSLELSTL